MKIQSFLLRALLLLTASTMTAWAIQVGDTIPTGVSLHAGFPPATIELASHVANKKVLLVGLPGAFTPT